MSAWTASGTIGVIKPDVPTVAEAVSRFFDDAKARQLQPTTVKKLKNLLESRLLVWCEHRGYRLLRQLDVDALRQFRTTWPDAPISAYKNLERLRSFFRFCEQARWIDRNSALAVNPPRLAEKSKGVKVFTPTQLKAILDACDRYPQQKCLWSRQPGSGPGAHSDAPVFRSADRRLRGTRDISSGWRQVVSQHGKKWEQDICAASTRRDRSAEKDPGRNRILFLDREWTTFISITVGLATA